MKEHASEVDKKDIVVAELDTAKLHNASKSNQSSPTTENNSSTINSNNTVTTSKTGPVAFIKSVQTDESM